MTSGPECRPGPDAVARCYPALCRLARALWRRHPFIRAWYGEVEDLAQQEAMYALLYGLRHWRPGLSVGLEYHLVKNAGRRAVQEAAEKTSRRPVLAYGAAGAEPLTPDDPAAAVLCRLDVAEAVGVLTTGERRIVEMRYGLGGHTTPRDTAELARELGWPRATLDGRLRAALSRLRTHFRVVLPPHPT